MLSFSAKGSFSKTEQWLRRQENPHIFDALSRFGQMGVVALQEATPVDTGETARSWTYSIIKEHGVWGIAWSNTLREGGAPVAVLIQYGHGTKNGGYVQGVDYINPALQPIFDQIADNAWRVVTDE